jgi:hypothetical protein
MVEEGGYSSLPPMTPTRPAWPLYISLESGGINCFTRWRVLATDIANIENKGLMSSGERRRVLRVWSGTSQIMTSGFVRMSIGARDQIATIHVRSQLNFYHQKEISRYIAIYPHTHACSILHF